MSQATLEVPVLPRKELLERLTTAYPEVRQSQFENMLNWIANRIRRAFLNGDALSLSNGETESPECELLRMVLRPNARHQRVVGSIPLRAAFTAFLLADYPGYRTFSVTIREPGKLRRLGLKTSAELVLMPAEGTKAVA